MGPGWKVRVGLIDDHPLFRKGLIAALSGQLDLEILGEAGNAVEASALIGAALDLAIVDVLMPGTSGITIAYELRERAPSCRLLALSVVDEPCVIADMLRAGADGFALKTQPIGEIIEAIRHVVGGDRYLPPGVSRAAIDSALPEPTPDASARLTKREREIFELIIRGFSNAQIAARLFIAQRTVETHRQRITKKLAARSIVELQRFAARHGGL